MNPVFLSLVCSSLLPGLVESHSTGLTHTDVDWTRARLPLAGEKAGGSVSHYSGKSWAGAEEGPRCEAESSETNDTSYSEVIVCALAILSALSLGFRLGSSRCAARTLQIPASLSQPTTATNSPPTGAEAKQFLFEDFSLEASPMLFLSDEIRSDCLETGRFASNFSVVKEMWTNCTERLLMVKHKLEGRRYLLREKTFATLEDIPRDPHFLHIESRLGLQSTSFLSYITSWVEASDSQVKLYAQVEFCSEVSLSDLCAQGRRLTQSETNCIFKQVLKAAHSAETSRVKGCDFAAERIYLDSHLRVKVADFDLKRPTGALRMSPGALDAIEALLEQLSDSLVLTHRHSC